MIKNTAHTILLTLLLAVLLASPVGALRVQAAIAPPCETPGWFPENLSLKDHHIFWYDGYYYLISINKNDESHFLYARSTDLCSWEQLDDILTERISGAWDELVIWAPFVYQENGVYYLYYTGVNHKVNQSIMLATSTDPSDPASWQPQGMIFQPSHQEAVWDAELEWSNCRDPNLLKVNGLYFLYYTGTDQAGEIIGQAVSSSPSGPWYDEGAIVEPRPASEVMESVAVFWYRQAFYLFYNLSGSGERYRISASTSGPWQPESIITPGWAHEVWQDMAGGWNVSYLVEQAPGSGQYAIQIAPLLWDERTELPRPIIGNRIHNLSLPLIQTAITTP